MFEIRSAPNCPAAGPVPNLWPEKTIATVRPGMENVSSVLFEPNFQEQTTPQACCHF